MPPPTREHADILLVGIAVVDAIARTIDHVPAPGGLRFFDNLTFTTGGNAINCAVALACLGVRADVVARVGNDPLGDFVHQQLTRHAIATDSIVRDPHRSTSFSFVSVPSTGERSFLHTTGANATLNPDDVPEPLLKARKLVFLTGVMLMDSLDAEPAAALLRTAQEHGATTLLDTVYVEGISGQEWRRRVYPALPHVDYFVPSEAEARELTGERDPARMAAALRSAGARRVVIKLGDRGVLCQDEHGADAAIPAFRIDRPVDTTGAGDCWSAGFLLGLLEGRSLHDAARLGNAVAAVSVTGPGATTALAAPNAPARVQELLRG